MTIEVRNPFQARVLTYLPDFKGAMANTQGEHPTWTQTETHQSRFNPKLTTCRESAQVDAIARELTNQSRNRLRTGEIFFADNCIGIIKCLVS